VAGLGQLDEPHRVAERRGPPAVAVAGANVPDARLLAATIEAVVLERPPVEDGWGARIDHDYEPHIALIRDERPASPKPHRP
jgi:hypothetical protein